MLSEHSPCGSSLPKSHQEPKPRRRPPPPPSVPRTTYGARSNVDGGKEKRVGGRYPFPFLVRHVVVYTKLDDGWDDDESRDDKEDEDDDGETHSLAWVKSLAG